MLSSERPPSYSKNITTLFANMSQFHICKMFSTLNEDEMYSGIVNHENGKSAHCRALYTYKSESYFFSAIVYRSVTVS